MPPTASSDVVSLELTGANDHLLKGLPTGIVLLRRAVLPGHQKTQHTVNRLIASRWHRHGNVMTDSEPNRRLAAVMRERME